MILLVDSEGPDQTAKAHVDLSLHFKHIPGHVFA